MNYFHITWASKDDGPGRRVVLFLQGCNLHCTWCHSPHSQPARPPVLYFDSLCKYCGACVKACPHNCHKIKDGRHVFCRENCNMCLKCTRECYNGALTYELYQKSASELYQLLRPELLLLKGLGGLTISGGEPLVQWQEVLELLKLCKEDNIHTVIETSAGMIQGIEELNPYVDCWLFGLKQLNPEKAKEMIGVDVKVILHNLALIAKDAPQKVIIRTPIIPGYTDDEENIKLINEVMQKYGITMHDKLPFNPFTEHYYKASGKKYGYVFE